MGAIVDRLYLDRDEASLIEKDHPAALVKPLDVSAAKAQMYRVIIPSIDEEEYYLYLLHRKIATSSTNFINRIKSDKEFATRMKAKVIELADRERENNTRGFGF